jgi:hypothetical protein
MMAHAQPPPEGARAHTTASEQAEPQKTASSPSWAALDADYGDIRPPPPEIQTQLPTSGFSWRFYSVAPEPPADVRVRLELPALVLWVMISGFWQGLVPWLIMGGALVAYSLGARLAFRQYNLGAQTWVYCAMGLGQIFLSFSYVMSLGPLWPFIGMYWLGVIIAWATVELRSLFRRRGEDGNRSIF